MGARILFSLFFRLIIKWIHNIGYGTQVFGKSKAIVDQSYIFLVCFRLVPLSIVGTYLDERTKVNVYFFSFYR